MSSVMRIYLARNTGFCWGVKRAIEIAQKLARQKTKKVYTLGPLIHNLDAVKSLQTQGIVPYGREAKPPAIILIRAHGIPPSAQVKLEKRHYQIVDATCPHVKVSEKKAKQYARDGYQVVIVGDKKHAEVVSLLGYARSGNSRIKPQLVSSLTEARSVKLDKSRRLAVLAQSTFRKEAYHKIINLLRRRFPDLVALPTICYVTTQRQQEVARLATKVDAMVVVGSHQSANTARLASLARSLGLTTFHLANPSEIPFKRLAKYRRLGIIAGTSTPEWITQSVINALKKR